MTDRVLLVDLENVQSVDLGKVPAGAEVMVFYGITQKTLPAELVVQAQPLGSRLQWIKIAGQGPNALDFHIAYYLGKTFTERRKVQCAVLSKDKGFDPLIRHLHELGHTCRRVASLKDAFPGSAEPAAVAAPVDNYERLLTLLRKEPKPPVTRKKLVNKVASWYLKLGRRSTRHWFSGCSTRGWWPSRGPRSSSGCEGVDMTRWGAAEQ